MRASRSAAAASPTSPQWDATAAGLDGVLLDLGVSSPQLDVAERGFSFGKDGPLDMRMDPDSGESAAQWLARADEREIADVLWTYGEERMSRRIATRDRRAPRRAADHAHRATGRPDRVGRSPRGDSKIHPATRSFQAIRIFINRELADLEAGLDAALRTPEARRPAGGDQLPFARGPHRQAVHRAAHAKAPPGNRRMPVPQAFAPTLLAIGDAQRADRRRTRRQSARAQRGAARGRETAAVSRA